MKENRTYVFEVSKVHVVQLITRIQDSVHHVKAACN